MRDMVGLHQPQPVEFSAHELRRRAADLLLNPSLVKPALLGAAPSEYDQTSSPAPKNLLAAVLIPIVDREAEATVLLSVRSKHLPTHAGQIAFPGGRVALGDANPTSTALREAEEELGLDRSCVEVIGFVDCYQSSKGFCIVPAVGVVSPNYTINPDKREVTDVFEVPLRFLMTAENHKTHSREVNGKRQYFYAIPYQDRYIWGVTASIIRSLYERLYT